MKIRKRERTIGLECFMKKMGNLASRGKAMTQSKEERIRFKIRHTSFTEKISSFCLFLYECFTI